MPTDHRPWRVAALVLLAYLGVVLLATFPTVLDLAQRTIGELSVDKPDHMWDLWWAHEGLFGRGPSPFFSDHIFHPAGTSLWRTINGPLLHLFGGLLLAVTGDLEASYNLVILLSLLASCLGGYHLGRVLGLRRPVAFFVGAALAFNPLTAYQVLGGLYEFANLGWAALFVGALIRLNQRRDLRAAAVAFGWYVVATGWCWYIGFLLLLVTPILFFVAARPWELVTRERRALLLFAAWGALVLGATLAATRGLGARAVGEHLAAVEQRFVRGLAGQQTRLETDGPGVLAEAARAVGVKDRTSVHALEVKLTTSLDPLRSLTAWEPGAPGAPFQPARWAALLLLAAVALVRLRRRRLVLFLGLAGVVSGLLALGPCLVVNGEVCWSSCSWTPFSLLGRLVPEVGRMQFPRRTLIVAALALTALAGLGLGSLRGALGPARRRLAVALIGACAALAVGGGASMLGFPVLREEVPLPAFHRQLAKDRADYALLELPWRIFGEGIARPQAPARNAFHQTVHGKRRFGGQMPSYLVSPPMPRPIRASKLFAALERLQAGEAAPPAIDGLRGELAVLRRYRFRYVVLHEQDLRPDVARAARKLLEALLGAPRVDRSVGDDPLLVFRVPGAQ